MSFERDIRKKLARHKTPVDIDALWNNLQGEIPTEKDEERRKRVYFYFCVSFLLLVLGAVGAFSVPTSPHTQVGKASFFVPNSQFAHSSEWNIPAFPTSQVFIAEKSAIVSVAEERTDDTVQQVRTQTTSLGFISLSSPVSTIKENGIFTSHSRLNIEVEKINTDTFFVQLLGKIKIKPKDKTVEPKDEITVSPKRKTRIGFTAAYANSKAVLKANNNEAKGFVRGREHSDTGLGTYQLSADLMIPLGKKWWFRTGLAYTHIREKTLLTKREETYIRSSATVMANHSQENMLGDKDVSLYSNGYSTTGITRISNEKPVYCSYNAHHFMDIPLVIAYEMGQKNVSLLVEGGLHFNLFHIYTQREVLRDKSYSFTYDIDTPFKGSTGLSAYTGVSLLWKVRTKTILKLGADWSYNIHSLSKSHSGIDQRYNTLGMNIGIMRSF